MQLGNCRLCHQYAPLKDSHYLSKSLYKVVGEGSDPVSITKQTAVQTSSQVKHHLLCAGCEDLFSRNGETWVVGQCFRKTGEFKLHQTIKPLFNSNEGEFVRAKDIPEIAVSKIVYFASSIFWRATAHSWKADKEELKGIQLGEKYAEEFRQFLLGQAEFSQNAALLIIVSSNETPSKSVIAPLGGRQGTFHQYFFYIPGIYFVLSVGAAIPRIYRENCIVRSLENRIYWRNFDHISQGLGLSMVQKARRVGRLETAYPNP